MARKIFYSFHFDNDVMRVQQIRNMGVLEGNEPVSVNAWEEVKKGKEAGIQKWINDNMHGKSCVVVLVGAETANRPWVKYEIEKAWNEGKGVVGIHIHNLKCPRKGTSTKGANPFAQFTVAGTPLSSIVKCYDPYLLDTYGGIKTNLEQWIEEAIQIRAKY